MKFYRTHGQFQARGLARGLFIAVSRCCAERFSTSARVYRYFTTKSASSDANHAHLHMCLIYVTGVFQVVSPPKSTAPLVAVVFDGLVVDNLVHVVLVFAVAALAHDGRHAERRGRRGRGELHHTGKMKRN